MIAFLFSPIGRAVAGIALAITIAGGIYLKIRHDVRVELEAQSTQEELRREQNAIRNADKLRFDGDRLRDADRNSRD